MTHKITDYITISEAVPLLRLTRQHVWRLCKSGLLKHYYAGRTLIVLKSDVDSYEHRAPGLKKGQKINRTKKEQLKPYS